MLWLWCRLAAAALIHALAWELAYAAGDVLKSKKKREKKKKNLEGKLYVELELSQNQQPLVSLLSLSHLHKVIWGQI